MWKWVEILDSVLRGDATRLSRLRDGQIAVPVERLTILLILLGAIYGFCMGCFAVFNRETPQYMQLLASTVKVPALFLFTLLVTLPSLYVFNALVGSRLSGLSLLRLLIASLGVTLAVLASFGPIVAFFSLTTDSYPFMKLLNVLVFVIAGGLGLGFLMQTLHRLTLAEQARIGSASQAAPPASDPAVTAPPSQPPAAPPENMGALERIPESSPSRNVRIVFACWVIVFGLVGAQMSWVLRPFIGDPARPFEWFRHRESNFFESVRQTFRILFD